MRGNAGTHDLALGSATIRNRTMGDRVGGEGRCPDADLVLSSVSAGGYHSCGMLPENEMRCWPSQNHDDEQTWPDGGYTAVSSGFQMSCALDDGGEVVCWESDGSAIVW